MTIQKSGVSKGLRFSALVVSALLSALALLMVCKPHGMEPWLVYGFVAYACAAQAGLWALVCGLDRGASNGASKLVARGSAVLVVSSALIVVGMGVSFISGLCHIL